MTERSAPLVNVPNALTLVRLLLVPLFLLFLFQESGDDPVYRLIASGVFAVAAITDRYDGHLARKHGLVTDFGKVADPIADKALTGGALIGLSLISELPWWVTVVILVREIGITLLRLALLRYQVIPASSGGKLKTLVQIVAIGLYLLPLPEALNWFCVAIMGVAVLLTVLTGIDYVIKSLRIVNQRPSSAKTA
jgi:CDP-diacylglycerol--glycerol-3-phosphate 3-phosphatidyltransferase